ncbi:MAG: four helix bundle protein, partial [Planctomycetaceae bacterium]|nr:four helix bundle protein [Planctomycetaceae bacterium]
RRQTLGCRLGLLRKRDRTKLRAFKLADRLAAAVDQLPRAFSADEQFGLTSQKRRAAVSVASRILEGAILHPEIHDCLRNRWAGPHGRNWMTLLLLFAVRKSS